MRTAVVLLIAFLTVGARADRYALVVGIENYDHVEITDDEGRSIATARLTCLLRPVESDDAAGAAQQPTGR